MPSDLPQPYAQEIFLTNVHIAGTMHVQNIRELEPDLQVGETLLMLREPENRFDELAICVCDQKGNALGYIPRNANEIIARLMDAGKHIFCRLDSKEYVGSWLKLMISVYLDD